jgi:hypothetical protein
VTIEVRTSIWRRKQTELVEFEVIEHRGEHRLFHGHFKEGVDGTAEQVKAKAHALRDQLETNPWVSPFREHREALFGDHGGAQRLASFVLSMFNEARFPFGVGKLGSLDLAHIEIAVDFLRSYHRYGENDVEFMDTCRAILKDRGVK